MALHVSTSRYGIWESGSRLSLVLRRPCLGTIYTMLWQPFIKLSKNQCNLADVFVVNNDEGRKILYLEIDDVFYVQNLAIFDLILKNGVEKFMLRNLIHIEPVG